jgi:hypothetical protein
MAKPTDFFVGITDLFSIILPGALMTYIWIVAEQHSASGLMGPVKSSHSNTEYLSFLAMSYLVGHGMDMVGAVVLDDFYDLTFADWKKCRGGTSPKRWLGHLPGRLIRELRNKWNYFRSGVVDKTDRKSDALLLKAAELASPAMVKGDFVYQWCRSSIVLRSPLAFSEIERLQANSKFFRGMVTTSLITAILSLTIHVPFHRVGAAVCVALAIASFLRYSELRWKAVQQTYRFYIAVQSGLAVPAPQTDSDAE